MQKTEQHLPRPSLDDAEAICRQAGARLTRLRRQVLALLLEADGPITAYELLDRLRAERSATPAGVYRSLDFLVAHGLAHRLESRKAFVACIHPDHPHVSQFLICRRCGTAVELEDHRIASLVDEWSQKLGFEVEAETLEVSGSCAACRSTPVRPDTMTGG
jgi:Fur family transcriptional regulator, zinc uptake regulator